jgi:preprotein translocase subunit SecE
MSEFLKFSPDTVKEVDKIAYPVMGIASIMTFVGIPAALAFVAAAGVIDYSAHKLQS